LRQPSFPACEAYFLGKIAPHIGVSRGHHRIVGLEAVTLAILGRRKTMAGQMGLERLVGLAIDQRDDVIGRS
jgi:hypothetical protein